MTDASLPLTPVKQELFVQHLMKGVPQAQAYEKAGYKPNPGNASELASSEKVSKRLAWLQQRQAARKGITVESLCDELDEARALATATEQPSAAIAATMGKAKLMGLLIDRKESGAAGEFAKLTTEELRQQLEADLAALEAMRKAETSH
jgi:hypothetical protein